MSRQEPLQNERRLPVSQAKAQFAICQQPMSKANLMFAHEHGELFLVILIVGVNIDIFAKISSVNEVHRKGKARLAEEEEHVRFNFQF